MSKFGQCKRMSTLDVAAASSVVSLALRRKEKWHVSSSDGTPL